MNRSPLSLVVERIHAEGLLGTQPNERLNGDFYGRALHFVADGERDSRRLMPPALGVPQLGFEHLARWDWLRLFNAVAANSGLRPDFMLLKAPPDIGGVDPARHKVACAVEFLAGLRKEPAARRRLSEVARPQKQVHRGRKPDKEFVYGTWAGLYLLMDQCLVAAGCDWRDVEADCFPRLFAPSEPSHDLTLSGWPDGYATWARKLGAIHNDTNFNLDVSESLDLVWARAARLASFDGAAKAGLAVAKAGWLDELLYWEPGESKDSWCFVLNGRPGHDLNFGRSWKVVGRTDKNPLEYRHASPLALLLAAMAADLHLARRRVDFMRLSMRMFESPSRSEGMPATEYQNLWNRAALRLGDILRAADIPTATASRGPRKEVKRLAGTAAGSGSVVDGPVGLQTPTFDPNDNGTVLLQVSTSALGRQALQHLNAWAMSGIVCFGQVYQPLTDELEEPFAVQVDDDWQADGPTVSLLLVPRPADDTVLQRFWSGEIDRDDVELRAFLVDAGPDSDARPVVFLQFIVTAL